MKVVVLGGGYVGTALLRQWEGSGYETVATTTHSSRLAELAPLSSRALVLNGSDLRGVQDVLRDAEVLVVSVAPTEGASYEQTYLKTAENVRDACSDARHLRQVVYLSATSVYGDRGGEWVDEDSFLAPTGGNGEILRRSEEIYLHELPGGVISTVLRLGGIHGPGREHEDRARRLSGKSIPGSADAFCNWVHREDIVRAIDWVIKQKLEGVFNLCSDDHPARGELYGDILAKLDLPGIRWDPSKTGPHTGNKRVSNEKIKKTGFQFVHRCREKVLIEKDADV